MFLPDEPGYHQLQSFKHLHKDKFCISLYPVTKTLTNINNVFQREIVLVTTQKLKFLKAAVKIKIEYRSDR